MSSTREFGVSHLCISADHFEPTADVNEGSSGAVEVEIQTPTHFVEKHIDKDYEFSEWALRRRALQLAGLRTKATHSTQTSKSHFRREGETQTWLPKCVSVSFDCQSFRLFRFMSQSFVY